MLRLSNYGLIGLSACCVSACVSLPTAPSVMVLPGTGVPFEQFANDDTQCRQFAYLQIGGTTPSEASVNSGLLTAAAGTALGAAAGAAIGGGTGAAIGAGAGLAAGGMSGAAYGSSSYYVTQHMYDVAYIQCMYAKGNRVPVNGQFADQGRQISVPAQTPTNIPPPPPGSPPPPPPRN
jgi:hypothetical protein